jgi:nitrate reductase NapA
MSEEAPSSSLKRRDFLARGSVVASGVAALAAALAPLRNLSDEYSLDDLLQKHYKELSGDEMKTVLARISAKIEREVERGKGVQFYGAKAGDDRALVWARPYEPPPEVPDDDYPFWLCTGRVLEHWHSGTMTGRVPSLKRAMPATYCELNPSDAAKLGVFNGDKVRIKSRRGSIILPVSVRGRSIPAKGAVFVPFFDETQLINQVTLDAYCPMSKEPDYKKCAVQVEKV